jgi:uncharacterized repeat protein (TIGR03803 family)
MKLIRFSILALLAIAFSSLTLSAAAQTVTFYDLTGTFGGTGWEPYSTVTQATDGNFYGTASGGIGYPGNIFRMTPSGEITNVFTFICSQTSCPNGSFPTTAPIMNADGNLYGITGSTFYKLTLTGSLKTLYSFGQPGNWMVPTGIILSGDGNFYGTTQYGGTSGNGSIFKITPAGQFTLLYSFCTGNCADGGSPLYPPVLGDDGNLYGTTLSGGAYLNGVIYQLTPSGQYTVLHNFCDSSKPCPDGWNAGTLAKDAEGNFVGTTIEGGANYYGVVFKITPSGQYSVLYNFSKSAGAFGSPSSQLILASDGNFYGTLDGGGSGSWAPKTRGAIYRVSPNGDFTPLQGFCQCGPEKGFNPIGGLFQGTDGNLYGTTAMGGLGPYTNEDWGYGTVFAYSSGLGPIVETVPVAGKAGQKVLILGNNLTGTTTVTFNGMNASFTVVSDTYIKATVPTGATTGAVSVVTPSRTLNSNPQFRITN